VVDQTIDGVVVIRTYVDMPLEPPAPPDQVQDKLPDTRQDVSDDKPDDQDQPPDTPDDQDDDKSPKDDKGADEGKTPKGVRVKVNVEVEVGKDLAMLERLEGTGDKPKTRLPYSFGSGFVVNSDGRIVTNYHVVRAKMEGCQTAAGTIPPDDVNLVVTLHDGRKRVARIVRGDETRDLAILKIDCDNLRPLEMGDSDKAVVGQPIVLMGHPLDATKNDFTVTNGIIAARRPAFLQISALAHPGNSGGPMMDMKGRVLGVLTQGDVVMGMSADGQPERIAQQGTARCVPSNEAKTLLNAP
jgi:S1-C subfamily serine protease